MVCKNSMSTPLAQRSGRSLVDQVWDNAEILEEPLHQLNRDLDLGLVALCALRRSDVAWSHKTQ